MDELFKDMDDNRPKKSPKKPSRLEESRKKAASKSGGYAAEEEARMKAVLEERRAAKGLKEEVILSPPKTVEERAERLREAEISTVVLQDTWHAYEAEKQAMLDKASKRQGIDRA